MAMCFMGKSELLVVVERENAFGELELQGAAAQVEVVEEVVVVGYDDFRAVGAENAEMTVGELPIDFIDPSLDEESLAGARQAVHFNGETGEHPNVVHAHHVLETETVFSGVHRSAAEEQIAQTSPRKIAQAVLCEGFDGEGITTCAMTHFSVGLNVRWMIMRAKVKVLTQKK